MRTHAQRSARAHPEETTTIMAGASSTQHSAQECTSISGNRTKHGNKSFLICLQTHDPISLYLISEFIMPIGTEGRCTRQMGLTVTLLAAWKHRLHTHTHTLGIGWIIGSSPLLSFFGSNEVFLHRTSTPSPMEVCERYCYVRQTPPYTFDTIEPRMRKS